MDNIEKNKINWTGTHPKGEIPKDDIKLNKAE
jgi:hypothetical protein